MNKLWKQKCAVDQLTAIRASLAGHLDNLEIGITSKDKFIDYANEHLLQIEELEPYLAGKKWSLIMDENSVNQTRLDKAVLAALGQSDDYTLHVRLLDNYVFFKLTNVSSGRTSEESKVDLKTWQRALLAGLIT